MQHNNKIQAELESCAIFEDSKPTNVIRLQSHYANLSNPLNFGRYTANNAFKSPVSQTHQFIDKSTSSPKY
ncbi:MAG: hypothetical protein GY797_31535 [Deltaproteobacteria bacterium]|nr:hypothetical protein [Deltaproteobacteria bacterium]